MHTTAAESVCVECCVGVPVSIGLVCGIFVQLAKVVECLSGVPSRCGHATVGRCKVLPFFF